MKHIRILMLALVLCLVALPASAQGKQPSPRAPQSREAGKFSPDHPSRRSGSAVSEDELLSAMETLLGGLCERGVITENDMTAILADLSAREDAVEDADSTGESDQQSDEAAAESGDRTPPSRRGRGRLAPGSDSGAEAASETESSSEAQIESSLDSGTLLALVENGMLTEQEYETLVSD